MKRGITSPGVRIELPGGETRWLQFHKYLFEAARNRLSRVSYDPTTVSVRSADGMWKDVELVFSRRRIRLPDEIALEKFELDANIGGITSEQGSIRGLPESRSFPGGRYLVGAAVDQHEQAGRATGGSGTSRRSGTRRNRRVPRTTSLRAA